jgi:SIR2-like protein
MNGAEDESVERLRQAYNAGNLTLYLGAGVSVENGLPTWQQLVLAMYFYALDDAEPRDQRPFPNYLFAIAEWVLERRKEPLEITARKIRKLYDGAAFIERLRETLYAGFRENPRDRFIQEPPRDQMLNQNKTLGAVIKLCSTRKAGAGVRSVVSYNYDNLIEFALGLERAQPIWKAHEEIAEGKLPVYHVHGYVPMRGNASEPDKIIFTEEQYHSASEDVYSWSNLVQIQAMSSSVGPMIGLSLTDPNMRRLLDAVRKIPVRPVHYVLLPEPQLSKPTDQDLKSIDSNAEKYHKRFTGSGIKTGSSKYEKITELIWDSERWDKEHQTNVLKDLGVRPIWYSNHEEIPDRINELTAPGN